MSELTLLSGQVKNLKVQSVTKSVFASNSPQKLAEAGALGAAALGSVYASSLMASSSLRMTQELEAFSCEINGVKLVGCFKEVTFMNHNTIECVVEYVNEDKTEAIVHAARDSKKKVIWVAPYQAEGEAASRKSANGFILFFSSFVIVGALILMLFILFKEDYANIEFLLWGCGITLVFTAIMALMMKFFARADLKDAKQATKVFAAFGYQDPEKVNLQHRCIDARFAIKEKTGNMQSMPPQWIYHYRDSDLTGEEEKA